LQLARNRGILQLARNRGILQLARNRGILQLAKNRGILQLARNRGILRFRAFPPPPPPQAVLHTLHHIYIHYTTFLIHLQKGWVPLIYLTLSSKPKISIHFSQTLSHIYKFIQYSTFGLCHSLYYSLDFLRVATNHTQRLYYFSGYI